jgi:Ca2+/H+ antiporter, TMEM165/GDT1 family
MMAVVAGGLLTLLPHPVLEIVVALLFLTGAAYMWRSARAGDDEEEWQDPDRVALSGSAWAAFGTSFGVVFVGEWGDITQILTANLAAKYGQPFAVGIGAVLGLWIAAFLAISAGRTLVRYVSMGLLQRTGAVILAGFAAYTAVQIVA